MSSVLLFQMIFTFRRWLEAETYFRRRRALLNIKYINCNPICGGDDIGVQASC